MGHVQSARQIIILLSALILFSCSLPPIYGLSDALLVPKWYASVMTTLVVIPAVVWGAGVLNGNQNMKTNVDVDMAVTMSTVSLCVLAYNVMYAIVSDMVMHGVYDPGKININGTFDNPSGFAMNMCLLISLAVSGWHGMGRRMRCAVTAGVVIAGMMVLLSGSRTGAACVVVVAVCIGKKHHKRTKSPSIAEKNMCEQQKKPIAICHLSIIYYLCNRKEEHDGIIAGSVLLLLQ